MILFTESPVPTKNPHPSLLMNYGCLGLCSTRNLAGLCKTIFWRVCFILNEEGRQEASRIKMDPLFKTLYLKLTKHGSSCHFFSLPCFSPEPFSSLQPVLSCMLGISQAHWRVTATRPGQNQKLTDGRTLVAAPATQLLHPFSQPLHQEGAAVFLSSQLTEKSSSEYHCKKLS